MGIAVGICMFFITLFVQVDSARKTHPALPRPSFAKIVIISLVAGVFFGMLAADPKGIWEFLTETF
jgi:hypothetical protein